MTTWISNHDIPRDAQSMTIRICSCVGCLLRNVTIIITSEHLLRQWHMKRDRLPRRWSRSRNLPGWRQCRRCVYKTCCCFNKGEESRIIGSLQWLWALNCVIENEVQLFQSILRSNCTMYSVQCALLGALQPMILSYAPSNNLLLIIQKLLSASPYDWMTKLPSGIQQITHMDQTSHDSLDKNRQYPSYRGTTTDSFGSLALNSWREGHQRTELTPWAVQSTWKLREMEYSEHSLIVQLGNHWFTFHKSRICWRTEHLCGIWHSEICMCRMCDWCPKLY